MAKVTMTEQRKEKISALLDNQATLSDEFSYQELADASERYSMIGDVLRGDDAKFMDLNIAENVAAALEFEEPHQAHNEQSDNVVQIASWKKPFAQFAIAASVAAVAIVGIQIMPSQSPEMQVDSAIPQVETMPFGGFATPVSYSAEPALETAKKGLRELQEQRVGALVLEHQRQSRLVNTQSSKQSNTEQENDK